MIVIMLGHRARHGKDTVAELLQQCFAADGRRAEILSFATPLKRIAAEAMGMSITELEEKKNNQTEIRAILQRFGSGLMKDYFRETLWRDLLLRDLNKKMLQAETLDEPAIEAIIIPDFRFPEEHIAGAITVRIDRPMRAISEHISEWAMDDYPYDHVIHNTGTLDDLTHSVNALYHLIGDRP